MTGRRKLEGKTKSTSACLAPCAKGSGDKTAATPRKAVSAGATRPFIHAGSVPARACARVRTRPMMDNMGAGTRKARWKTLNHSSLKTASTHVAKKPPSSPGASSAG